MSSSILLFDLTIFQLIINIFFLNHLGILHHISLLNLIFSREICTELEMAKLICPYNIFWPYNKHLPWSVLWEMRGLCGQEAQALPVIKLDHQRL